MSRAQKMTDGGNESANPLSAIEQACGAVRHIELFCDYDGVLAPIASRPQDAILDEETQDLLQRLCRHDALHVSIVTGRALADIRTRVGIAGITHVGNHGLEIDGPGVHRVTDVPHPMRQALRALLEILQRAMQPYPGVIVEDKGLVIAVHFRLAEPARIPLILKNVSALLADRNADHLLRLTSGKSVVEVRPDVAWNKGEAVRFLLEERHGANWAKRVLPIYLGDDETDEDAFLVLRDRGVTVRVGEQSSAKTAARYALQDTEEVRVFLDRLLRTFP